MVQKVANGDFLPSLWRVRKNFGDWVVELHLPFLDQLHHHGCGELLGDTPDSIDGLWSCGHFVFKVGETEPFRIHDLAIFHDRD